MQRALAISAALGLAGFCLLPWFGVEYGLFEPDWIEAGGLLSESGAPGLLHLLFQGRLLLALPFLSLALALLSAFDMRFLRGRERLLLVGLVAALLAIVAPPFVERWTGLEFLAAVNSSALGYGAMITCGGLFVCGAIVWSKLGLGNRDAFTIASIGLVLALVGIFVFYPILHVLVQAFAPSGGQGSITSFLATAAGRDIWGLACLSGGRSCGVAINSLLLGVMTAGSTTLFGLAFALLMTRTNFPAKKLLRALTILPIITPPFVVGLALILLFGRAGAVTTWMSQVADIEAGRWLYGFWGVWLTQTLAFTPIAFLVLIGVVEGVSPSLEEAAQTLRADLSATMRTISLPLFRPGLANAFLLGFIESLADFGNPLVLGGAHGFLSTEIYFAVVGAQANPARAAVLAIILLLFTLGAFLFQRRWVGRKNYATITGKGDNGAHTPLSSTHALTVHCLTLPWLALTVVVYGMILYGSFVKLWGLDHGFTLDHYREAFGLGWSDGELIWNGSAWGSLATTLSISLIAAPLTAALGLLTAWLLVRQQFVGKSAFEFATMLSFAVPGTVVGLSYILAFNVPPIELTGTGIILVLCFVFRNMPVGVRGGIAAMKQIDHSLDEASLTLGADSSQTLRKIVLPLLRPAIVAAIAYSFIRAITSVSAVIFLVSADHNMATAYIVGLVENGNYGVAIAYANVLIAVMLVVVIAVQLAFGTRRLRRHERLAKIAAAPIRS
ncbi:MAG: iron ABC transporter permease [Mesorhizobium sp.]|uniref:ABC transporter permease n=1 Tax=Mesorhizobium sp. TaxID=1871066 RepID=UPI000FE43744|nr:iron ABC transporter permease [Mesorhizobium sp.]RWG86852.1 MAG: iron ABC transporter permease [Mesorhizobium sp.]RWK22933.1 MAG: iron ABC transporter permease [Mesorhizobium sp.]RWK28641.1 MAG: iron ABC transporter permease [Mesorhizobium sp.]TIQ42338.1 MAG: iron ABC transporter permease [Mesorhizobium sp.]